MDRSENNGGDSFINLIIVIEKKLKGFNEIETSVPVSYSAPMAVLCAIL